MNLREWFIERQQSIMNDGPKGIVFGPRFEDWVLRDEVRSFESDLYRRLAIGYAMMKGEWEEGCVLNVEIDDRLEVILEASLAMRLRVMDEDLRLIKTTYWEKDVPRSDLVKDVARLIMENDYQQAKRWIEDNLKDKAWFNEYKPKKEGRGRRGIMCRFGFEEGGV